jgi:hypothetical protein
MFTLELTGLPELQQAFQRLAQQAHQALVLALQAEADRLLEESYPLVPVLTGAMISSGTVINQADGADIRYGNFGAVPYTLRQHEDTTLNHPRGGQHHFLSAVVLSATGDMAQRLAHDMQQGLASI